MARLDYSPTRSWWREALRTYGVLTWVLVVLIVCKLAVDTPITSPHGPVRWLSAASIILGTLMIWGIRRRAARLRFIQRERDGEYDA